MKIYVASSWRNARQPAIVEALRTEGHEVYDFRNPAEGDNGFGWRQVDPRPPAEWSAAEFREILKHPIAKKGFAFDMGALRWCDACVLVLPCGRSAHLELGWATGAGRRTIVLCEKLDEPELMYLMCDSIAVTLDEVIASLVSVQPPARPPVAVDAAPTDREALCRHGDPIEECASPAPLSSPSSPASEKEVVPSAERPVHGAESVRYTPSASATPGVVLKEGTAPALGTCGAMGPAHDDPHPYGSDCSAWTALLPEEQQSQSPAPTETALNEEKK